jgi:hypothetical protein
MSKNARMALADPNTENEKMRKGDYTPIHGKNLAKGLYHADTIRTIGTCQDVCHPFTSADNMKEYFIRSSAWLKNALHDFKGEDSGLRYRMVYTVQAVYGREAEMLSEVTTMHLSSVISYDERLGVARCITCKHNHFHKLSKMYYNELTPSGKYYKGNLNVLSLAIIRYDINDGNAVDVTEKVLNAVDTSHALQKDRAKHTTNKAYCGAWLTKREDGPIKTAVKFNENKHKADKKIGKKYQKK